MANIDWLRSACSDRGFTVDLAPSPLGSCEVEASFVEARPVTIVHSITTPVTVSRSSRQVALDRSEFFVLPLVVRNRMHLVRDAGEATLQRNQTCLIEGNSPYRLSSGTDLVRVESHSVAIPADALRERLRHADDWIGAPLTPDRPGYNLLFDYVGLIAGRAEADPDENALAGTHILDLLALALRPNGDAAHAARQGARSARRQILLSMIAQRAGEPDLDLTGVAQAAGLSRRYVQALLNEIGTSFSDEVRRVRLAHAMALLRDRRYAYLSIAQIAFASGFSDISTFNRGFRATHGDVPSAFRVSDVNDAPAGQGFAAGSTKS